MATVTKLEDRGTYWSISYDDGGFDDVPKDPNVIDTAATNAEAIGQVATATKLRAFAAHIRRDGKPVDVPMGTGTLLVLGGIALGAVYWLTRRGLR